MSKIPLGKVAFVDKGAYNNTTEYAKFDFITTLDSSYYSKKDGNVGHPLTDTTWWGILASGKQATEAAETAAEATEATIAATTNANDKAAKAAEAAANANGKASLAENAAETANNAATVAAQAKQTFDDIIPETRQAIKNAQDAYGLATSIEGVDKFSQRPSGMSLEYDKEVLVGTASKIKVTMFPRTAQMAVVFALAKPFGEITPDGVITSDTAGVAKINVYSCANASVKQTAIITFREAVARTTEDGQTRETEDGQTLYV